MGNCGLRSLRYADGVTTFISSGYPNGVTNAIRSFAVSILVREYIFQLDLQPTQDRLQLAQRNVVFAPFDTVEGSVGNANLFREIRVRKAPACLPDIARKFAIQISLHQFTLAKCPSRMRDDFSFTDSRRWF